MDHFASHLKREGLPAVRSAGRTYPSVAALLASLDWIEAESLIVLGVDGVRVDGDFVARSLDHIADFTSLEGTVASRSHASVEAARDTLTSWDGEVEFVDVRLAGHDSTVRDVIVIAVVATVLAVGFMYLLLSLLFADWGP
jgi:hypothetical protein